MSQELIYTSAEKGLKSGSRGFCTVVSTEGMARNLAERLESLSGYRHAFPLIDAMNRKNPVAYSHLILSVGGVSYHVLSRIGDAGIDYTGRSNKLAHHVVLSTKELPQAGPATCLLTPGFVDNEWDGRVRTIDRDSSRPLPSDSNAAAICTGWQEITGDPGWGGVLASSMLERSPPVTSIIYPPGLDTLPLIDESLRLLTPIERWSTSFSTYFTRLPAGVACNWRFILDGSPEADSLRARNRGSLIDLCGELPAPPASKLVEAARTGVLPKREQVQVAVRHQEPSLSNTKNEQQLSTEDLLYSSSEYELEPLDNYAPIDQYQAKTGNLVIPPNTDSRLLRTLTILTSIAVVCALISISFVIGTRLNSTKVVEKSLDITPENVAPEGSGSPDTVTVDKTTKDKRKSTHQAESLASGNASLSDLKEPPTPEKPKDITSGEDLSITHGRITAKPRTTLTEEKKKEIEQTVPAPIVKSLSQKDLEKYFPRWYKLPPIKKANFFKAFANEDTKVTEFPKAIVSGLSIELLGSQYWQFDGLTLALKPVEGKENQWIFLATDKEGVGDSNYILAMLSISLSEELATLNFRWMDKWEGGENIDVLADRLRFHSLKFSSDSSGFFFNCQLMPPHHSKPKRLVELMESKAYLIDFPEHFEVSELLPSNLSYSLKDKVCSFERLRWTPYFWKGNNLVTIQQAKPETPPDVSLPITINRRQEWADEGVELSFWSKFAMKLEVEDAAEQQKQKTDELTRQICVMRLSPLTDELKKNSFCFPIDTKNVYARFISKTSDEGAGSTIQDTYELTTKNQSPNVNEDFRWLNVEKEALDSLKAKVKDEEWKIGISLTLVLSDCELILIDCSSDSSPNAD